MRLVSSLLAAVALVTPMTSAMGATIAEKLKPHDVELSTLIERPHSFENMRVRFRATFVQTAGIFSSYHTRFSEDQFLNLVVWDDDQHIWKPTERAKPVDTLYFPKQRIGADKVSELGKYTVVMVTGEVVSDYRGQPWISCHAVEPVENEGSFTDNAIYHLEQGLALNTEKRFDLSDEHFASALMDDLPTRSRVDVLQMRGSNLIDSQDYDMAIDVLSEAVDVLEADPELPRDAQAYLHYLLAKAQTEKGQRLRLDGQDVGDLFELAVANAEKAVRIKPSDGDMYAVLGISLAGLERFDDAKRQCERAIRLRPDNAEVRWYLGRILDLQESYDEAIAVLRQAIDLAPKDYRLHKAIARSFFNRSNLGGQGAAQDLVTSLREYDISLRLNNTDPDLHYWSGIVLETATERGQKVRVGIETVEATYPMAIERFQNCLAVDENYTEAHVRLGYRYRAVEDHEQATGHFRKAIEIDPHRAELYELLGRYYWELNKKTEAYDIFALYNERDAEHVTTLYALGRLSYELEEYERAVEWLQKLREQMPQHAMANADLTECYSRLGKHKEAIMHADITLAALEDNEEQVLRVHTFKGLTLAAIDDQAGAVAELNSRVADATMPEIPVALGWALTVYQAPEAKDEESDEAVEVVDASVGRIQQLAKQALALDAEHIGAKELLGWSLYLSGDFAGAEKILSALNVDENPAYAYRLGMSLYKQGANCYGDASAQFEKARSLRSRSSLLKDARADISAAERAIRVHDKKVAREKHEQERQMKKAQ